ncbi:MAG: DUF3830 family protein [candidate division Zixibacteria bacterium]|nr:DUF3830 family protein [candidate division Zixibacteria bacterium]
MNRRIRFTFVDENVSVEAELLEEEAPRTCQGVWDRLPLEAEGTHAIYSGSEIAFFISKDIVIEPENQTSRVIPGDIGYYYLPPSTMYGWKDGLSELCWFYDRDARPHMPEGPVMINLFARFVGDTTEFYRVCRRMRREGVKRVRVDRS